MALNTLNSSNLEQLALKGLMDGSCGGEQRKGYYGHEGFLQMGRVFALLNQHVDNV